MTEPKRELVVEKLRKLGGLTARELENAAPTVNIRIVLSIAQQHGAVRVDLTGKRPKYYPADEER